jgi:hypothetical protein
LSSRSLGGSFLMSYSSKKISILGPVILEELFKVSGLFLALFHRVNIEINRRTQKKRKESMGCMNEILLTELW